MSFLRVSDLAPDRLRAVVDLGLDVKRQPDRYATALTGRSIGLFFEKQSLRTWVSCDVGAAQLGAHPLTIRQDQTGMGSRETPEDVGRTLDRYLDLLAMRVFRHGDLEAIDAAVDAPVVNLLSDHEHPCQAVADVMTLAENGLMGGTIAYIGDGNNVCHSLMVAVTTCGGSIRVATAPGYEPDPAAVEQARSHGDVVVTTDPIEAVEGANAVYTDVWASMGQEEEAEVRRSHFARYRVDETMFGRAASDAIFLHCLPAHRGDEVTHDVLEHERSRVFDQAENRLHSFKAVLLDQLG
jgi:ornithine carbamoyltransferase